MLKQVSKYPERGLNGKIKFLLECRFQENKKRKIKNSNNLKLGQWSSVQEPRLRTSRRTKRRRRASNETPDEISDRWRKLCFPFVENGATSRLYTMTKSHHSFPWPKEEQLRANLSIYPSRKLSLGYQTFRDRWYIFFFFSDPPTFLSLSLSMRFFLLSGGHVYLLDPVPRLYRQRSLRRRPSGTSGERFWVVTWEESSLSEGVPSSTRFARSPRFFRRSKSLEIEKDPFLGVAEKAAPLVRHGEEIKGARAVSRESGLHYERDREYSCVRLESNRVLFLARVRNFDFYWFIRCRICTKDQTYFFFIHKNTFIRLCFVVKIVVSIF